MVDTKAMQMRLRGTQLDRRRFPSFPVHAAFKSSHHGVNRQIHARVRGGSRVIVGRYGRRRHKRRCNARAFPEQDVEFVVKATPWTAGAWALRL